MRPEPKALLARLLRDVERHRLAIREFGMAGYVTMVERHRDELRSVHAEIREHCRVHGLPLPEGVPAE